MQLDRSNPRVVSPRGGVIPLRKAGNVFVVDLWVKRDLIGTSGCFHPAVSPSRAGAGRDNTTDRGTDRKPRES